MKRLIASFAMVVGLLGTGAAFAPAASAGDVQAPPGTTHEDIERAVVVAYQLSRILF